MPVQASVKQANVRDEQLQGEHKEEHDYGQTAG